MHCPISLSFQCMGLECCFNLFYHIPVWGGVSSIEKFKEECPKWTDKYAVYHILVKICTNSYLVLDNIPESWDNEMTMWNVSDLKNSIARELGRHTGKVVRL